MAVEVDGVLKEWGDRLFYATTTARATPRTTCGYRPPVKRAPAEPRARTATSIKDALTRATRKAPEVVVKISGGGKDLARIKAHFDYISRNGAVALEDETGRQLLGRDAVRALRDDWATTGPQAIPHEDGYRREALHVILSMPAGTDRAAVRQAASEFSSATFPRHQYIFASHEDEAHAHVHLCVRSFSRDLIRLNPRKADLRAWRETFAGKLRDHGIDANATPRSLRGRVQRGQTQAIRHIDARDGQRPRREPTRTTAANVRAATAKAETGTAPRDPTPAQLATQRAVIHSIGRIATTLTTSPDAQDKTLAMLLVEHVRAMAPALSPQRAEDERLRADSVRDSIASERRPRATRGRSTEPGR